MQLENYEAQILGARETSEGYVHMHHEETYRIKMVSKDHRRCDARVSIDGLVVGIWRIKGFDRITIERPAESEKLFTFFASGSKQAVQVGEHQVDASEKGVVKVEFLPEKTRLALRTSGGYSGEVTRGGDYSGGYSGEVTRGGGYSGGYCGEVTRGGGKGLNSGVTGLTGRSSQQFGSASSIEHDLDHAVTIELRLVVLVEGALSPLPGRLVRKAPPPIR